MGRRLRTIYLKQRRYQVAAHVVTVIGAVAVAIATVAIWSTGPEAWLDRDFLAAVVMAALVLALVARLVARLLWRHALRRHYEEFGWAIALGHARAGPTVTRPGTASSR